MGVEVLINGLNKPVVEKSRNARFEDGVVTFEAEFLIATDLLVGLKIASVIPASAVDSITDVVSVAAAAVFGPTFIEVN